MRLNLASCLILGGAVLVVSSQGRLLSKYRTPRFRIGRAVFCEVRGQIVITGITKAPIPWPIGKGGRGLCADRL